MGIGLRVDWEMVDGERHFVVKSISQKGGAARDGKLRIGDILLSVDGAPVHRKRHAPPCHAMNCARSL
jgi:S1-C subfamily serine protease